MAEYFAIAITRTCGSGGGSYIGKKLAADYGIDLYDRKLLRLASEDSGINEKIFADADENTKKTFLYRASRKIYSWKRLFQALLFEDPFHKLLFVGEFFWHMSIRADLKKQLPYLRKQSDRQKCSD